MHCATEAGTAVMRDWTWFDRILVTWMVLISVGVASLRFGYIDLPPRERSPRPGMASVERPVNLVENSASYPGTVRN